LTLVPVGLDSKMKKYQWPKFNGSKDRAGVDVVTKCLIDATEGYPDAKKWGFNRENTIQQLARD